MTVQSISAGAESIIAIAQRIKADAALLAGSIDPPPILIIKRKLTTVSPSDVSGANAQEKIDAAHAEAIERNRPMRWDANYQCTQILLDERHDGLVIEGGGFGPVLPDVPDGKQIAWGWLYYVAANAGKSTQITMRGVKLDGNRLKAARQLNHTNSHTQHGIAVGNTGLGRSRVILENCRLANFDGAGGIVLGDGCELHATDTETTGNGFGGLENTRGMLTVVRGKTHHNDGLGYNPSAGVFTSLNDCDVFANGGGGLKVSLRPDSVASSARLHLNKMHIYDNKGYGLAATSSSVGTIITGDDIVFSRNERGSMNLTTEAGQSNSGQLSLGRVLCDGNAPIKADDNTADILLYGGSWHANIADLIVRNSGWRGISGGWGSRLEVGRLRVDGCAGPGVRWQGPTLVVDDAGGENGLPDEISA